MINNIQERRAIILYDGSASDIPGVERDVRNYDIFLRSSYGGSWKPDEIIQMDVKKHSKAALLLKCRAYAGKYLLLIYVGHGTQDILGKTSFSVKDRKWCSISELEHFSRKQVTIVDCCRVWSETLIPESVMEKMASAKTGDTSTTFISLLNKAKEQNLTIYACSSNQFANDTPSYSTYLISRACEELQRKPIGCISIRRAHELASNAIAHLQTPEICLYSDAIGYDIPFAITL